MNDIRPPHAQKAELAVRTRLRQPLIAPPHITEWAQLQEMWRYEAECDRAKRRLRRRETGRGRS